MTDFDEGRRLADAATEGPWMANRVRNRANSWELGEPQSRQQTADFVSESDAALIVWLRNNAPAMFDEIEKGRQWEAVARRLAGIVDRTRWEVTDPHVRDALAAFRELADPS